MSNYITVKSIYADNGRTARIKTDIAGCITKRQADRAVRKLCIAGDYIKLDASCNKKCVSIYDQHGNFIGQLS
jgi:hypothetical protein